MRIILGSDLSFVLNYGYDLTGIAKPDIKVGYVTTASNLENNKSFFENIKDDIRKNGYHLDEIDIENKSEEELENFFSNKNVIHVEGGNTFHLLKVIRETKFDRVIKSLLERGVVYIGTSAGAYIMCPSIEVASWANDKDECGVTDFTALNYVPFVMRVHFVESDSEVVRDRIRRLKYPIRLVRDGQGILIENGKYQFIGGREPMV